MSQRLLRRITALVKVRQTIKEDNQAVFCTPGSLSIEAMPQVKIYGLRKNIEPKRFALSHAIHLSLMEAIATPEPKRFQRFIILEPENFIFPSDRTSDYTIIEITMFEGRSVEAKKNLIRLLYRKIIDTTGIKPEDLEITLLETPKHNWGVRGIPGDELNLNYRVDI